jgi:hypothetical protein
MSHLENILRAGLSEIGKASARVITKATATALEEARAGIGRAAREADKRIKRTRDRIERIVEMPPDGGEYDKVCSGCGYPLWSLSRKTNRYVPIRCDCGPGPLPVEQDDDFSVGRRRK